MSYELKFLDNEHGTITEFHGVLNNEELIKCTKERYSFEERNKSFKYIINDYADVTKIDVTADAIVLVANMAIEISKFNKNIFIAAVMPTDLSFGLGRMWQAYADKTGWTSNIFHTRKEAEEWIEMQLGADLKFV